MRTSVLIDEFKDLKYILNYYSLSLTVDLSFYDKLLPDLYYLQLNNKHDYLYLCLPYNYFDIDGAEVVFICKPAMVSFLKDFYT